MERLASVMKGSGSLCRRSIQVVPNKPNIIKICGMISYDNLEMGFNNLIGTGL